MVTVIGSAVLLHRRLEGVQSLSAGPVADRVHVDLETLPIQPGHGALQQLRFHEAQTQPPFRLAA